MTPEQWSRWGSCPTCEAVPGAPCTTLDAPHPARPLASTPDTAANLLNDLVTVAVREGVVVRPGDTLVLRLDAASLHDLKDPDAFNGEMEMVRQYMNTQLPTGARCVVIAMEGQIGVVRSDEEL